MTKPEIGDVWISKARRNERAPKGRVHVTDVQVVRDVPYVWAQLAESFGKGTSRKIVLGEFLTDYEFGTRPGMKPVPPPEQPGDENATGLRRVGELDPAAAIVKGAAENAKHAAIFDTPFEQPTDADREAANRRAVQRAERKPVTPDIAEKDLPF